MFLKSLSLKGFKSFADPVTLRFEPGVTVIVGPNGSGKSNIVDAVAWVLGAQSPRTVRSSRMEDVIFSGTESRPALGRAEVSLTIDNGSRRLPVDLPEITITRTLFRSGDSEYALNGAPCRLLDIQELLADTGVGRQQHVIISQGQLDTILSARPEERRLVIEEAAGVLKHRRRRERAERRLAATEENLERLGDLLREVRRQRKPLERQAAAARSHTGLVAELSELRLYLAGQELESLEAKRRSKAGALEQSRMDQVAILERLGLLDAEISSIEVERSGRRRDDLGQLSRRVEGLRERARGLLAVLEERRRALLHQREAVADIDVVSSLESEAAQLAGDLAIAEVERAAFEPRLVELAAAEARLGEATEKLARAEEEIAGLRSAEEAAAEARGRLDSLGRAADRGSAALEHLNARMVSFAEREQELEGRHKQVSVDLEDALGALERAASVLQRDQDRLSVAAKASEYAEQRLRDAEAAAHGTAARAEALAAALADIRHTAGVALVAKELEGHEVLGTFLELVDIDPAFEAAFEAAVGPVLTTVVVEKLGSALAAMELLADHGVAGSVLALELVKALAQDGSHHLPPAALQRDTFAGANSLPEGASMLCSHISNQDVPDGIDRLVDMVLGDVVVVDGDWRQAVDVLRSHPGAVVVTMDGDRLSAEGWQLGSGQRAVSPVALREAERMASTAAAQAADALEIVESARKELDQARLSVSSSSREFERASGLVSRLEANREQIASELERLAAELVDTRDRRDDLAGQVERDRELMAEMEARLVRLEDAASQAGERLERHRQERRRLEEDRVEVANLKREISTERAVVEERHAGLTRRLQEVERRLASHVAERRQAAERRVQIETALGVVDRLAKFVSQRFSELESQALALDSQRRTYLDAMRASDERLEALRAERIATSSRLEEIRSEAQRREIELTEIRLHREALVDMLRKELATEPEELETRLRPDLPEGIEPQERASQLQAELEAMGPINPLALEEFEELEERYRFLEAQVEDVRSGRRELHRVIRSIDEEIMSSFAAAFADVDRHFAVLMATLFPGGSGRLVLTDPDHLFETGVEVEARFPGRGYRKLSLLSGGERSLVALAFLFAVFRSRPSPFYLMDEVEAALDDVSLHRFLSLIAEFRDEAQLVVVSHQKLTMESADVLYGVTAAPGGSSKVLSERLRASA